MNNSILLINPPSPWLIDDKSSMPLGILYLASYIRETLKYPMGFIDLAGKNNAAIPGQHRYYGITSVTPQWPIVKKIIEDIKKETPEAKIIVGGAHPSALPHRCLEEGADYAVIGEGERSIEKILNGEKNQIVKSERIEDLDTLPFPARELVEGYKKNVVICSRGCPFACKFCCTKKMWGGVKIRSVRNVISEIDDIIKKSKTDFFMIQDETFGFNKKWADEFCEEISKRKIKWGVQTRARICTPEFLEKVKKSGCVDISLGIESGSRKMLKLYSKDTPELNLEAISNIAGAGLKCRGFFIAGLPGETEETIAETEEFIIKAKRAGLAMSIAAAFIPYPGCELYDMQKNKNDDFGAYYHFSNKEYGYGNAVTEDREQILKWKDRLQNVMGESNEFMRLETGDDRGFKIKMSKKNRLGE